MFFFLFFFFFFNFGGGTTIKNVKMFTINYLCHIDIVRLQLLFIVKFFSVVSRQLNTPRFLLELHESETIQYFCNYCLALANS